jgi:hypothetical protein
MKRLIFACRLSPPATIGWTYLGKEPCQRGLKACPLPVPCVVVIFYRALARRVFTLDSKGSN